MKAKNNVPIILFMCLLLIVPSIAAFLFYNAVRKPTEVTTVNLCNEVSIDSIKKKAVEDTVLFFIKDKQSLEKKVSESESIIYSQKKTLHELKKNNDSLVYKIQLVRNRYRELKSKVEEVKE